MTRYSSQSCDPFRVCKELAISAASGSHNVNVFKVTGSVRILEQYAEITEITTLTNLTALYSTLYDSSASVDLTADGAVLSGLPVGTMFTKDKAATEEYTVCSAAAGCVNETASDKKVGKPFTVTAKTGADTFIRMNFSTTDDPVSFKMLLVFEWEPIDGGGLELLL